MGEPGKPVRWWDYTHSPIYLLAGNLPGSDILAAFHTWHHRTVLTNASSPQKNEHNSHLANKRGTREFSLLFIRAKNAVNVNHLCNLCKICPFPINVRCPNWSMPLMLSPIQRLPCVQTLQLAGCKLKNNACGFILLLQRIFFFSFWAFVGN